MPSSGPPVPLGHPNMHARGAGVTTHSTYEFAGNCLALFPRPALGSARQAPWSATLQRRGQDVGRLCHVPGFQFVPQQIAYRLGEKQRRAWKLGWQSLADVLQEILERLPGVGFASRLPPLVIDPANHRRQQRTEMGSLIDGQSIAQRMQDGAQAAISLVRRLQVRMGQRLADPGIGRLDARVPFRGDDARSYKPRDT